VKYTNYFEKEINNVCHLCIVGYKKYGYHLMSIQTISFALQVLETTMIQHWKYHATITWKIACLYGFLCT